MSEDEADIGGDAEYGMVMPFVVCASAGGPYDDEAFCAGYDLATLDTLLDLQHPPVLQRTVRTATMPQVDLIAMKHGYSIKSRPWPDDDGYWTMVDLLPTGAEDSGPAR